MFTLIAAGITAIGTGIASVFGYKAQKSASEAQSKTADAQVEIAKEQTKQTYTAATSNVAGSYYNLQISENQQDTIVKVAVILAIMLVLVTRIKRK